MVKNSFCELLTIYELNEVELLCSMMNSVLS
jgi:hypothetical protein